MGAVAGARRVLLRTLWLHGDAGSGNDDRLARLGGGLG